MPCPSCGQDSCSCHMSTPYQICDCNITYFAYCLAGQGGDNYGTQISNVSLGGGFDMRLGVKATKAAGRVVDAGAQFTSSSGATYLALDNASFLNTSQSKPFSCELKCQHYRLTYSSISGSALNVTSGYRYDGSPINAGDLILGGQMVEFDDPDSLAPLSGKIGLTAKNDSEPYGVTLSSTLQDISYGMCVFSNNAVTGDIPPGHDDSVLITAGCFPPGTTDRIKATCSAFNPIMVSNPLNTCNVCSPQIPDSLRVSASGLHGSFAYGNGSYQLAWSGDDCIWFFGSDKQYWFLKWGYPVAGKWGLKFQPPNNMSCELQFTGPSKSCVPQGTYNWRGCFCPPPDTSCPDSYGAMVSIS